MLVYGYWVSHTWGRINVCPPDNVRGLRMKTGVVFETNATYATYRGEALLSF